jgi:hypothetical protein
MRIFHLEIARLTPGSRSNRAGSTVRGRRTVANCGLGANGFLPDTRTTSPSRSQNLPKPTHARDTHRLRLGYRWPQLLHSGGLTFPTDVKWILLA